MGRLCCVILAGGPGRGFKPLSDYFQKCMIPLGSKRRPLLEYVILHLRSHGIRDLLILIGYKYNQIVEYFGDGSEYDVDIKYVIDSPFLWGTGGALLNAYRRGHLDGYDNVLVYYGDILSNINLSDMIDLHISRDADATLAVSKGYQLPVSIIEVNNDGLVKGVSEKPKFDVYVGIGIMIFKYRTIMDLEDLAELREIDLMSHFIPYLLNSERVVCAYRTDAFWYDIGSIDRYEELEGSFIELYFRHYEKGY